MGVAWFTCNAPSSFIKVHLEKFANFDDQGLWEAIRSAVKRSFVASCKAGLLALSSNGAGMGSWLHHPFKDPCAAGPGAGPTS